MKITYYGHSCFSVELGGKHLLFDPFISQNELAKDIEVELVPADYIFISHGHFDHITDALSIAARTGATLVANWEIRDWLIKNGAVHTHPINPGGQWSFEFGKVKCVNAVHSSSLSDGTYGGSACGFVVKAEEGYFYYSGDTGLTLDMQLITNWSTIDVAILPIGDALTMGIEDAVAACKLVGAKKALGVHYNTFGFIVIDCEAAVDAFAAAGIELLLPKIGECVVI